MYRTSPPPVSLAEFPELIRMAAVARYLGISESQVWRLVSSGDIPSVRLSPRAIRVPRQRLEAWLKSKEAGA
jgi:excisionase family DNA binding protein